MNIEIFQGVEEFGDTDRSTPTDIKVIGVGGGGGNAVNRMIMAGLKKVHYVVLNTDMQALQRSNAHTRMPIGSRLTNGLGAGGMPEIGEQAAMESRDEIRQLLEGTDMVFITAGMGGGTGTGAAPIIAEISKDVNALTVAVVTTPFAFEGKKKMSLASEGIEKLRKIVDTLIIIPNQYLLKIVDDNTPIKQAFQIADDVLRQGVQGISELITEPGEINIDFADVRTVMKGRGDALMGIGIGEGENRAVNAATAAINNPLLENARIEGAKGILVNLSGGDDLTLKEYQDVVEIITQNADEDALIIAGQAYNPELGDRIKVTVVATGFNRESDQGYEYTSGKRKSGVTSSSSEAIPTSEPESESSERPVVAAGASLSAMPPQQGKMENETMITIDKWEDLQRRLGSTEDLPDDFTYPAVLRYRKDGMGDR